MSAVARPVEMVDLARDTDVPGVSQRLRGHLVRPDGDGPWPAVLVLHEAFGVDEVMLRQCRRLADAGYLVLLPDLFSDGGAGRCLLATFRALRRGRGRAVQDVEAGRRYLLAHPSSTGRVGAVGFCMGGAFALLTASTGFDVVAPSYGLLPRDLDAVLMGACPVVASYGARDPLLPGAAAKLERSLVRVGVEHDVAQHPGAGHSFLNDAPAGPWPMRVLGRVAGIGPHPEAAADAWQRIQAFLAVHLRGE